MPADKERLYYLIEANVAKKATPAERKELMDWIRQAGEDSELRDYMQEMWNSFPPESRAANVDWDAMFRRVVQSRQPVSVPGHIRRIRWYKIAAAASVIFLLASGTYLYFTQMRGHVAPAQQASAKSNDVKAPTQDRAVLTLGDGSVVLLDSTGQGELATQGDVQVRRTADGRIVYTGSNDEPVYNTLSNPRASNVISLKLSDGTALWLNTGSSVTFPVAFTGRERAVSVTGEVYFEVTPMRSLPFVVAKGDTKVQVLGTHFNVNAYDDEAEMRVTLLEGSVKVSNAARSVVIRPGQQAGVAPGKAPTVNNDVDVAQVMAWKNGLFSFDRSDLGTVMRQLERWYDVQVEYRGAVPDQTFGGDIQRSLSLAQVLKVLQSSEVHFEVENKTIIVMP